MAETQIKQPASIKGRLLPRGERDRSAKMPTSGCTMSPDRGPAMKTSDMNDLERPNSRR